MTVRLIAGDCREVLPTLPDGSVQCVVTSPPYYGLRDYGVSGQIGLESSVEDYVAEMVAVFGEVRRVLRDDGVLFLNLGDSYANDTKWGGSSGGKHVTALHGNTGIGRQKVNTGLKPKDLIGVPWRVAFALQNDGWYLRSDIIWAKPNPMPESVRDRPTKAHEYIFLLTKSPRYFWDAEAVREPHTTADTDKRLRLSPEEYERAKVGSFTSHERDDTEGMMQKKVDGFRVMGNPNGRNIRSVWTIPYKPDIMTEWIGKIGFCQRCGGLRVAGNGSVPTMSKDTVGSATHPRQSQENFGHIESRTKSSSDPSRPDSQLTIFAGTEGASTPTTSNPSPCERTSCEATLPQPETSPRAIAPKDTNTVLRTLIDALTASGSAANACECDEESNSLGSVWNIATAPFSQSHFATFPPALAERCIKAGTSEKGACAFCGSPWARVVELVGGQTSGRTAWQGPANEKRGIPKASYPTGALNKVTSEHRTTGWQPTCACPPHEPVPCVVLDPFAGAGTTGLVADRLGRDAILLELSPEYVRMIEKRLRGDAPLFAAVEVS